MTVRTARNKRTRLTNRRRLNAARPAEPQLLPLMVVKADGTLAPVHRAPAAVAEGIPAGAGAARQG